MIQVKDHRTKVYYANFMKDLIQNYPDTESIRLIQDNLNTHTAASFYEAFPPQESFELMKKFECHYTPIKDSWLNMVEIEISALSRQCLDRRIGDIRILTKEVSVLEQEGIRIESKFSGNFLKRKQGKSFEGIISMCRIYVPKH